MLSGCYLVRLIFLLCSWVMKCSILIGSRQRFAQVESSILRSIMVRQCTKIGCKSAMSSSRVWKRQAIVFTDKRFHRDSQFLNVNSHFLKWKKMIDSSCRGWFFWTFHIWYKVMSNTCYVFSPLFPFHCFSQFATNFTIISENSLTLLLLKCLPSNAMKKWHVKIVEHKLEEAFCESKRDYQLGRFILLSVLISQQLSRLT